MSWRTNAIVMAMRNMGRVIGLNRVMALYVNGTGYETRYNNGFLAGLRPGDCVWDVGANIGYYTELFSERVGSEGSVFAFEPSPENFTRLRSACARLGNVRMLQSGLGLEEGTLGFQQGSDELGATSRVVEIPGDGIEVDIRSGVSLVQDGIALPPNAIKVDVEGFELEVLQGFGEHLGGHLLRVVGIEVHFRLLKERGIARAPKQIEDLLFRHGFRVCWPDSSHILAMRQGQ